MKKLLNRIFTKPSRNDTEVGPVKNEPEKKPQSSKKLPKIIAYGFEQIGFKIPDQSRLLTKNYRIEFVEYSSPKSLDSASGVIFPSGIFESFRDTPAFNGSPYTEVKYDRDVLLQREREIYNLASKNGWVCCLVTEIFDEVPQGDFRTEKCDDIDLAKKLLNAFSVKRIPFKGSAVVNATNNAFKRYIERYGVAKTIFDLYYADKDRKVLAKSGDSVFGVEFFGRFIFLPVHTTNFSEEVTKRLFTDLSGALSEYLQKRNSEIPSWANDFSFQREGVLDDEIKDQTEKVRALEKEKMAWVSYKGLITQSGDTLKDTAVSVLRSFFKLNVTDVEEFREDALIKDDDGNTAVVVEVKGTKGGVKRNHINQIDSNRERVGLTTSVPGLLIINDQMSIENIDQRSESSVAAENVVHAKNSNILIMRTIDMMYLMKNLEHVENPGNVLMELCKIGGGRMIINGSEAEVINF